MKDLLKTAIGPIDEFIVALSNDRLNEPVGIHTLQHLRNKQSITELNLNGNPRRSNRCLGDVIGLSAGSCVPGIPAMVTACVEPRPLYCARNPHASDLWRLLDEHFDSFQQVYDERYQAKYGYWRPF
ncbi:MAG: hypothetical protein Q8M16_20470 [Pirellulaceae bacterium]|nr:hypothetical protein [Pirellulaceae bacterium]